MRTALYILPLCAAAAFAGPFDIPPGLARKLLGDQEGAKSSLAGSLGGEASDNSIVPKDYQVGGGDVFQIGIVGLPSHEYTTTVDPNGDMYIADVGKITLGKISLADATTKIQSSFRASLKNRYEVYVSLKRCKRPVVSVIGAVPNPGTFRLEGTHRLLDAIKLANHGQMPDLDEVNLRQVRCGNGDSTLTFDLLMFLAGGDASQNPYVYPGDRIEVRNIDYSICVGGAVSGLVNGRMPFIPGETLGDIMPLLNRKASADTTYVLHRRAGHPTEKTPWPAGTGTVLTDNDVITVPSRENLGTQDTVLVSGETVRTGTYPIQWGKTTAQELLDMAGGPTKQANLRRAIIIRSNKLIDPSATYQLVKPTNMPPRWNPNAIVRPELTASLGELVSNGDYAIINLADFPNGSVKLESGDEIHVPRKENFVYVSGHVRNPGAYPFKDGEDAGYYVSLAKGYSDKADKPNVTIMRHYKGITQLRDPARVEEGDMVVVPASIEYKRFTGVYLPMIQTLATIASLALTYVAVTRSR